MVTRRGRREWVIYIYYLDILFLLNVGIHLILFRGTARLLKTTITTKRLFIASSAGASTVFIVLTPFEEWLVHPVGKIVWSLVLVWIGFGYRSFRMFLKTLCMFYMTSFVTAGILIGLHSFYMSAIHPTAPLPQTVLFSPVRHALIFLSLPVLWGGLVWMDKTMKVRKMAHQKNKKISISIDGKWIEGIGLIDTGNQLKDPFTKKPVLIMNLSLLKTILTDRQYAHLSEIVAKKNWEEVGSLNYWEDRFRLIPYRTAGHEMNIMLALCSDVVIVHDQDHDVSFQSFLIGLDKKELSSTGEFQIVFPADAFHESWETIA